MYQGSTVYCELKNKSSKFNNRNEIPLTIQTILRTMKCKENVTCMVQPAYFLHFDKELRRAKENGGYPEIDENRILYVDLVLHSVTSITDLFKNGEVLHQVVQKQEEFTTQSAFFDSRVSLRLKLQLGDKVVFDNLTGKENDPQSEESCLFYDLEHYRLPAFLRRILKTTKLYEIVRVDCAKLKLSKRKALDFLPDEKYGVFDRAAFGQAIKNGEDIMLTFKFMNSESKEHINKLAIADRMSRLGELMELADKMMLRS